MLRSIFSVTRSFRTLGSLAQTATSCIVKPLPQSAATLVITRSFSFNPVFIKLNLLSPFTPSASSNVGLLQPKPVFAETVRTNIKFSKSKGKRKTVKVVLKKFYRLHWGMWIHAKCGRHKKLYKKSAARRRRLQYHVFTNATQSYLLDKMVTRYWRRPRHYVDDPYEPYHTREEFPVARQKPFQPFL